MPQTISWAFVNPSKTEVEVKTLGCIMILSCWMEHSKWTLYCSSTKQSQGSMTSWTFICWSFKKKFLCENLRRIWTSLHWALLGIFLIFCDRNGLQNREWFHLLNFMFSMLNNYSFWVHKYWDKNKCQYEIYSPHVWSSDLPTKISISWASACILYRP